MQILIKQWYLTRVLFGKEGYKYVTDYKDNKKVTRLRIILPQMIWYAKEDE